MSRSFVPFDLQRRRNRLVNLLISEPHLISTSLAMNTAGSNSSDSCSSLEGVQQNLRGFNRAADTYAAQFVDAILAAGQQLGASDLHLRPTPEGIEIGIRIDGVLQQLGTFPAGKITDIVTRLKVLANLLTYRTDVPQEGRIRELATAVEMRVCTFPTLYGEKAVVRLFATQSYYQHLTDLGLPDDVHERLDRLLGETSGAILIAGPAGSGKTTTVYACLRELVRRSSGGRSLATLEDPIEVALQGVAQSQVNERVGLDLAAGLRAVLRQDPEVIAVGEIRDPLTANTALQASLTGQLVLTTFHAASAAGAIGRLSDMAIEPYILRSGIRAVICQRLVRRLCSCSVGSDAPKSRLGMQVRNVRLARSCPDCHGTGYRGRLLLAEMLTIDSDEMATAILNRWDTARLQQSAVRGGMETLWRRACQAVDTGLTSPDEIRRVLGFSDAFSPTIG